MAGAAVAGMQMRVATPAGYEPPADGVTVLTHDPAEAVDGADAVYTDVWASMGQEEEAARRRRDFAGFTVDDALMADAGARCGLPALPARPPGRGGGGVGARRPAERGVAAGHQPDARPAGRCCGLSCGARGLVPR